jgi:hypothetical protein
VNRRSRPSTSRAIRLDRQAALRIATLACATALAVAMSIGPARAATYKWVDENGKVHYTDKMPTEGASKGGTMLDKQARPVKKIDPPPTAAELRAREAVEEQKRLAAKQNEEIARRDRALISSYTTEQEIDLARSRALGTIDSQLESAHAYVDQLSKRRDELIKRKASLDGKPLPPALEREMEGTESELEKTAVLIDQKRKERQMVLARYEADRTRWRELKAIADANAAAAAANAKSQHPAAAQARR